MDLSKFSIRGKREHHRIQELKTHNNHLIMLRWLYVGGLMGVAVVFAVIFGESSEVVLHYLVVGLVLLCLNGLLQLTNNYLAHRQETLRLVTITQIILDTAMVSYIVYSTGGIEARTIVLFAIPIIAAGLLFSSRVVYAVALLSSVGYIASTVIYQLVSGSNFVEAEFLLPLVFYMAVFLIMAYLLNYLLKIKVNYVREQAYDAFLNMLSHSLMHPASTAGSILDVLQQKDLGHDKETKKYLAMLENENTDLINLINNLLETASESDLHASDVDLVKLTKEVVTQCAKRYGRQNDIEFESSTKELILPADSSKLTIALSNIIDNAFKYSDSGTLVRIKLSSADEMLKVSIEDSGSGIPKDLKKKALAKYSTSDNLDYASQGLGLGLFVANKIAQLHHGYVDIESSPGKGTKVIIKLKRKD